MRPGLRKTAAAVVALAGCTGSPDGGADRGALAGGARVEHVAYDGWADALRISNDLCELVVVPATSRIMRFALRGEENLLWSDPRMAGKVFPTDDGQWHNLGGDKVWPTQQSLFGTYMKGRAWPPPYEFDSAPALADEIAGGVRLTGPLSGDFGARLVREIVLDGRRSAVLIRQRFVKSAGDPAEMTVWNVTQTRRPAYALLPLGRPRPDGLRHRELGKFAPGRSETVGDFLVVRNDDVAHQKAGIPASDDGRNGWVACVYDRAMILESHALEAGPYPDEGCHGEVYLAPREGDYYVELELLSPLVRLSAGGELRHDIVWQIAPLAPEVSGDPARAAEVARAAHREALAILGAP